MSDTQTRHSAVADRALDPSEPRFLASDNTSGICPDAMASLLEANQRDDLAYGDDRWTARAADRFRELFETDCEVFFVFNGTAANSLALASLCQSYHSVVCHQMAHIETDECGGPEFFSNGSKLLTVAGDNGRITPEGIDMVVTRRGDIHYPRPKVVSLTQATEVGTVYQPTQLHAIRDVADRHDLRVHMDGARFANALVRMNASPAEITWKAGVDVLSFGATKAGALAAEAVVFFEPAAAAHMAERRKRAGHLLSKHRFLALQFEAFLKNDCWLRLARHANAMADRLAAGLTAAGRPPVWPVEANLVFITLPKAAVAKLNSAGAQFYVRASESLPGHIKLGSDQCLIRLVTSFATRPEQVEMFVELAAKV